MDKFCITTLSCGKKYNKRLLESLTPHADMISSCSDFFITTDDPLFFEGHASISEVFKVDPVFYDDVREKRQKRWFNYHLKRIAIRNAFQKGYNKIFYIDSDIEVTDWDVDFFIKKQKGFWFRSFLTKDHPREKYDFYVEKYRIDLWHYYRQVSEKIIYIHEDPDKINGFLNTWDFLDEQASARVTPYSEGHEILIACRFNGSRVDRYRPDPFKGDKRMKDRHGS